MSFRISEIRVPVGFPEKRLLARVLRRIRVPRAEVERFSVVRRGLDARRKGAVRRVFTAEIALRTPAMEAAVCSRVSSARLCPPVEDPFPRRPVPRPSLPPVVVGAGPAGLFAALTLARFGAPPILLERGRPVEERARHVRAFWTHGRLDPESNVQFGEGGAGTFSDGKLTTRIGDPLVAHVLSVFARASGLDDLPIEAKPHVGTDRLRRFCRSVRADLEAMGAEIRFGARVDDLSVRDGSVRALTLSGGGTVPCETVILAIGHSARDTIRMLHGRGVGMSPKPFAVGLRVEHPRESIDRIQYGRMAGNPALPPADYRLSARTPSGRGVYSFCVCPGGAVIAAASAPGQMAVNGMSANARASGFTNGGIVAQVGPEEFGGEDVLAGISFQERLETESFARGGEGYGVPAMNLMAFLSGADTPPAGGCVRAAHVAPAHLSGILPEGLEEAIRFGLRRFGDALHGFATVEATLYAVESRTSSPVRIEREAYESTTTRGLYPVGEGGGHAGGIVSSAVDGIRAALCILARYAGRAA